MVENDEPMQNSIRLLVDGALTGRRESTYNVRIVEGHE